MKPLLTNASRFIPISSPLSRPIHLRAALIALVALNLGTLLFSAPAANEQPLVPDGANVSFSFPAGQAFVLGDPVQLSFVLSNAGPAAFKISTGGDYRGTGFPTRYKFTVLDEKGSPLRAETWMEMGGLGGQTEIKPGGEHVQPLLLQNYVRVDRPGVFSVQVVHDFGWKATKEKPLPIAQAKITIALPTAEQAETRVRAIAAKEDPPKENALGSYRNKTDFRYLSHPVFLPALEKSAGEGSVQATEGIQRIETKEATLALTRLLANHNDQVMHAAALFLSQRMPPRMAAGHPRQLGRYATPEESAIYTALWMPQVAEPLRMAAAKLLKSRDVTHVRTGAFIVEAIGKPEDAPLVLGALGSLMEQWKVRENPEDNILNTPGPGDALIFALAGLRERGYRAPRSGGVSVIMARFLELGDTNILVHADGWEQSLEAFFTQNPPMLREAAVRALPKPPSGQWEKLLLQALSDRDRGVMRTACIVAGGSSNPVFAEPLANIVRTEHHPWVVRAASEALTKLGAHWAATDAWIERLADEKMYYEGLAFLAGKLEHPKSAGSSGRNDLPREARLVMRKKWQTFFLDPERQKLVQMEQPVPISEAQARDLFSGCFHLSLITGNEWPAEKH